MSAARRVDLAGPGGVDAPRLAELLAAAHLVCFPTDTVYGIGGVVTPAVRDAVITAKGREANKPLQVIYPSVELLAASLELEPRLLDAVRRLLPGPLTLLLPHPPGLEFPPPGEALHHRGDARGVRAEVEDVRGVRVEVVATLGVRVPSWPRAALTLGELPFALLASSANPSGGRAPRSIDEVDPSVLAACDLVLDAGPVAGMASTVLDLSVYALDGRWRILRRGAMDERDVAALLIGDARGSQ